VKALTTEPRRLDTTGDDLQMQYLVSVIDDKSNPGSTDRQPAISAFNERLIAEGYWVFAGGLADTDAATVIDNRGEQAVFSDGPFVESKEYLAGVWVWEAPIWMWRSSSPPRRRRSAIGRSRCGRSSERRRGGDHPGPPRGVGAGGRLPNQTFR
jgi:hypothetical protein